MNYLSNHVYAKCSESVCKIKIVGHFPWNPKSHYLATKVLLQTAVFGITD